jgi:hypothetical protein
MADVLSRLAKVACPAASFADAFFDARQLFHEAVAISERWRLCELSGPLLRGT